MRRLAAVLGALGLMVSLSAPTWAAIIDFHAVALRPANDGSGEYGTITEWANGNGVTAQVPKAGQKVYYGTDYFNGWMLSSLQYIEFTYKRLNGGNNPYTNVVISKGDDYGVISSQGGETIWQDVGDTYTEKRMRYYYSGNSGNVSYGFRFYEPSPDGGSWPHGTNLVWDDIDDWTLLGIGEQRPLSTGEDGVPRAPVEHGLAIMWGDSADNYLGNRDIYDVVVVSADGTRYLAGIPEPASIFVWSLLGTLALAVGWLRHRTT